MSVISSLVVELLGDVSDFNNKMAQAENMASNMGKKLTSTGLGLTAGVTAPILGMGVVAVNSASDLEESLNKVNVVFGESASEVSAFANTAATSMGMSKQSALEALGTFGNLFDAMGVGSEQGAGMSTSLVQLASDLASFNNLDPTVALDKLRAGIVGETEPLRALGVNVSALAVQAKAMQLGLVEMVPDFGKVTSATNNLNKAQENLKNEIQTMRPTTEAQAEAMRQMNRAQWLVTKAQKDAGAGSVEHLETIANLQETYTKFKDVLGTDVATAMGYVNAESDELSKAMLGSAADLDPAIKAQAAYAIILEQTENARGDFVATSDGMANSTRILKAQMTDLSAEIGAKLLPYGLQIIQWLMQGVTWFTGLNDSTKNTILIVAGIAAALGPLLMILGTLFSVLGAVGGAISAVGAFLAGPLALPILLIIGLVALLAAAWANNWGGIREKTALAIEFIKSAIGTFIANVQAWWAAHGDQVIATVQNFMSSIGAFISNVLGAIQAWWAAHGAQVMAFIGAMWATIKNIFSVALSIIKSVVAAFQAAFRGDWYAFGENLRDAWDKLWAAIKTALTTAKDNLLKLIKTLVTNIIEKFKSTDWGQVGRDIIDGIVNGLKAVAGKLAEAAKNAAGAALEAVKGFLGIKSPSLAFYKIGVMSVKGMAEGLEDDGPVKKASQGLAASALAPQPIWGNAGAGGNSVIYNVSGTFKAEPSESVTDKLRLLQQLR